MSTPDIASSGERNPKFLFVTGTRADFGKQRDIMLAVQRNPKLSSLIVVTGMHLIRRYGYTVNEIEKAGVEGLHKIPNQIEGQPMSLTLATTLEILTRVVHEEKPDAIIVHGDRVEALAAALAGSLANVRVIHIEGGEVSGTIDDAIRHSISKHAHIHLVTNDQAKKRLLQLGEGEDHTGVHGAHEHRGDRQTAEAALRQAEVPAGEVAGDDIGDAEAGQQDPAGAAPAERPALQIVVRRVGGVRGFQGHGALSPLKGMDPYLCGVGGRKAIPLR